MGEEIVFVHRETRSISWSLDYEHFSPPAHVYVLRDRFSLRRLDPGTGPGVGYRPQAKRYTTLLESDSHINLQRPERCCPGSRRTAGLPR